MNQSETKSLQLPRLCKTCFCRAMNAAGEDYRADDPEMNSIEDTARDFLNEVFASAANIHALEVLSQKGGAIIREGDPLRITKRLLDDRKKITELLEDEYKRLPGYLFNTQRYFGAAAVKWLKNKLALMGFHFDDRSTMISKQSILPFI